MDRAQRLDEKKCVICLVMFTPRFMVIKMLKMAHFLYFLLFTGFFCLLSSFFIFLPSNGYLTTKHINHTIFRKNSVRSFRSTCIFCPNYD